jgi:hypothetical protein
VLRDNRRQRELWERDALAAVRRGDIDEAVDAYRTNGRLHTADTSEDLREQLVAEPPAQARAPSWSPNTVPRSTTSTSAPAAASSPMVRRPAPRSRIKRLSCSKAIGSSACATTDASTYATA